MSRQWRSERSCQQRERGGKCSEVHDAHLSMITDVEGTFSTHKAALYRTPVKGFARLWPAWLRSLRVAAGSPSAWGGSLDMRLPGPVHARWTSMVADVVADLSVSA